MSFQPRDIVDQQFRAYNARDIEAYCALFAANAVISRLNDGQEIARGIAAIRRHYTNRFRSETLHCQILSRIELGQFVIDHERVAGIAEGSVDVVAIYEVSGALVQSIRILWQ